MHAHIFAELYTYTFTFDEVKEKSIKSQREDPKEPANSQIRMNLQFYNCVSQFLRRKMEIVSAGFIGWHFTEGLQRVREES